MPDPKEPRPRTGPGYKNDYNRLEGNGPMDDTTRTIVKFVHGFKESDITPSALQSANRTMIDSVACIVAGFEEEAARAAARAAQWSPAGELKSTVLGYGVSTTPELAAFANGCLIRCTDFNDNGPGGHTSDLIPAALAVGEALHSTGSEVLQAIVIGYEISGAPAGGEAVRAAMVAGRLMKLDEDRLANAVGIALVPHVALNKGVGALSMWKGTRSAEATKCGVWSAVLARAGMTGPPQPFEGRGVAVGHLSVEILVRGRGFHLYEVVAGGARILHTFFEKLAVAMPRVANGDVGVTRRVVRSDVAQTGCRTPSHKHILSFQVGPTKCVPI
jgi:2-methylcitrate dehydratase